jgi:hypothetical protein
MMLVAVSMYLQDPPTTSLVPVRSYVATSHGALQLVGTLPMQNQAH